MASPTLPPVRLQNEGPVAVVWLSRPDQRNSLDEAMVNALVEAFDTAEADPSVRAIVVAADGPAFCAGAVLETLIQSAAGEFDAVKAVYEAFLRVKRSPLPTIAAVNGPAVGAGLNLALACDVRLASPDARFESRFPALRLHPGGGHTWMLEQAVGRQTATLMALFGQVLDAEEALRAGLVASVHPAAELIADAIALGSRLARMDREFVIEVVDTLRLAEQTPAHADIVAIETERQLWSTQQRDFVDRTTALQARISKRQVRD